MTNTDYAAFLDAKAQQGTAHGFAPVWLPDSMFPFQRALCDWAIRKGRCATLADTGLGKTFMELVFAENVVRHTNRNAIVLTPLAVAPQFVTEGEKFGVGVIRSRDGKIPAGAHIVVTNYERLHLFDPTDFAAVIGDESGCIKAFEGQTKAAVTDFMRTVRYRLLATATAAPNDYIELGTHAEALGELGYMDMLSRFFANAQSTSKPMIYRHKGADFAALDATAKWRFKGHAEVPFWRWVCSWARAIRKPSDLGFDDGPFRLPPLIEREHTIKAKVKRAGMLFDMPAVGLQEEREERRRTIEERCEKLAEMLTHDKPAVAWCHLNDEGDLLARLIPGAVQVSGKDDDDAKEEVFAAFSAGKVRAIVTKPKIGAWGLNWQHCPSIGAFASHSFEQHYQQIRRCWRFGQKSPVTVDTVCSEGEAGIMENLRRKQAQAEKMFAALVQHMRDAAGVKRGREFEKQTEVPAWLAKETCDARS